MMQTVKWTIGTIVLFGFFPLLLISQGQERQRQLVWQEEVKKKIRFEVKEELTKQFRAEVNQIVEKKVETELALYFAKNTVKTPLTVSGQGVPELSFYNKEKAAGKNETIEQAIHRTVEEAVAKYSQELSAEEMDEYVASGGSDAEVKIPGGMKKKTDSAGKKIAAASKSQTSSDKGRKTASADEAKSGSKERTESLERTLRQKGSILLPKGKLQAEESLTYAHFSSNRIVIDGVTIQPILVVGSISVDKINRDIFISTTSLKYGLLNNLQTELRVPYRYEHDNFNTTAADGSITSETNRQSSGLGDITLSASRQIGWDNGGLLPDLVASWAVKTPSGRSPYGHDIAIGTGHWATSLGLVAAKSSDPAVIFGSLAYSYNFEKNVNDYGRIKPGDAIGFSLGTAIALSYQTAISFSFDQTLTMRMDRDGSEVPGSFTNAANFKTGFNWAWNERFSTDLGVSFGLTEDSPDLTVDLRFPYTF